jgi:ligand-binding sensor domain-containing protein
MVLKGVLWGLLLACGLGARTGLQGGRPPAVPYPGQRPFVVLGPDDGLPPGGPIAIAQDRAGFIWMGTEGGLVRYNRGQCRRWTPEQGLPSAYIGAILPDAEEGLWLGTQKGLIRFREGRFEAARLGDSLSQGAANQVTRDAQGRICLMTAQGLFRQQEGLRFSRIFGPMDEASGAFSAGRRSGALYLALATGLRALQADGTVQTWGEADGLPPGMPTLVVEDGLGRLWAGSGRTLVMKEPGGTRFQDQSSRLPGSLSPNSTPFVDGDGSLWLPTQNGALHLDGARMERLDREGGLPFQWVRSLFRDREGTLWVLGPTVARLQGGGRVWNYALTKGAPGEMVWSITRHPGGTLLVGTDDGAARLQAEGLVRIPGTEGRRIKAMAVDGQGTLWMVSTIGPALWLRAGRSRAEQPPLGELGLSLNSITRDSAGEVWLGHARRGLLRWDPKAGKLGAEAGPALLLPQGFGAFLIREDPRKRLWVGTTAGLLVRTAPDRWRLFSDREGLRPHTVRGMAFLPDGSAWLHYQEPQGLTRVRLDGDNLTVLEHRTTRTGLRTDLNYAVQVDGRGRVWVSTDQGLDQLDSGLHFGRNEGMIDEDCSIHALLVEEGRIWVGTSGGLVRVDTSPSDAPLPPPRAQVIQAQFGGRVLDPPLASRIEAPFGENTVVLKIAAPTYLNERDLRFQVRLVGLEDAWRNIEHRAPRYPALPGRSYRFEVRAAQGGGDFGPAAGLDFVIHPPWWKTGWCLTLEALAAVGLILGILRLRVASLARSRAALAAQVKAQTEELRARNEELSTALTHVHQLSGLLPICANCKKIRDDRGEWTPLESYITQHSEADFTHGICPTCIRTQYPDFQQP